ncbi:MAG: hypothetical protein IH945_13320, partial [Armatimonadetes bacterium]|nr:hypothetical protein [Armatimonadota bacterium]
MPPRVRTTGASRPGRAKLCAGRADGLTKVKGTLINPASLHDRLSLLLRKGVVEYQIVITREVPGDPYSPDALVLRLACDQA